MGGVTGGRRTLPSSLSSSSSPLSPFLPLTLPLLVALLLVASSLPPALAVGIGVNNAAISYEEVLQNGYAQEEILVMTDSETPIAGAYELVGDIAPWVRIEPAEENFTFSSGQPHRMTVIVEPPPDARLGDYSGGVRVLTGELAREEGGKIGTTTRAAFLIRIALGVTGTEHLACTVGGVRIRDTEIGQPFDFLATVQNGGNVRIRPEFSIAVYDQYQTELVANLSVPGGEDILPTVTQEFLRSVAHRLPEGQYWATVAAPPCDGGATLTFDVLAPGGVADKGELLRIELDPWASTGDIVPVKGVFRNDGSRTVSAKLTGTVTRQDSSRIFKVIDTDRVDVLPGETKAIETFFNPVEPGRYIVAGRVLYNNKITEQRSAILNVKGPFLEAAAGYGWLLLILLAIVILLLLILIARKRRRQGGHRIIRR